METQRSKWLFRTNADGVLVPTPFTVKVLMGAMFVLGLLQGGFAFVDVGVPIWNAMAITMIPIFGSGVAIFILMPLVGRLEKKANKSSDLSSKLLSTVMSGSLVSVSIVGFPLLFVLSKYMGMPFQGLCQALLIPHWYHFALAAVVGMTWPCNVLWIWSRSSKNVSKTASVVLQTR